MSEPLKPEQLSDLSPNQSLFELISGREWIVISTSRNEHTRLASLRIKNNPSWGTYTLNERSASEFSLVCPTKKEIKKFKDAREEEAKWEGDYRKFWAPCDHDETEKESAKLTAGKTIDSILESWMSQYQVEVRLLTDMWCGLYIDIQGTKIYVEGDTPLLCFAMANKVLTENPPREDYKNVFEKLRSLN